MSKAPLFLFLCGMFGLLPGCVERFYPDETDLRTGLLVINAHITNEPGIQHIEISRSTTLDFSAFEPEAGCYASLIRADGESRDFFQSEPGYYSCDLDADFLQLGASYQVQVLTADASEYHSEFDKLRPAPEIDSIYYELEEESYASASETVEGIRFYIDFTYDDEAFEYIRWELTETYEFHNPYIERVWKIHSRWYREEIFADERYRVCYITHPLSEIHTMSMQYLDQGSYIKKPFSFVPNIQNEQKLHHKYSLLVKQYSMGAEAFHYWNELKKTSQEQGFLFDSQPALLESNICNVNDETERVLGFFSMESVKTIRGITGDLSQLDQTPNKYYCMPIDRGPGSNVPTSYPAFLARATYDGVSVTSLVNEHCIDCRAYKGSTHIKPDYW